jgi:hypothetical protein
MTAVTILLDTDPDRAPGTAMAPAEFARRFGARLVTERRLARRPLWVVATRSSGEMTIRDLRDAEAGLLPLDAATVLTLASLYGIPVREVLGTTRRGLAIGDGVVSLTGVSVPFRAGDAASLVEAFFRLIRTVRAVDDDRAAVAARAGDLEHLADHLHAASAASAASAAGTERGSAASGSTGDTTASRDDVLRRVVALAELEHRRAVGGALCASGRSASTPPG